MDNINLFSLKPFESSESIFFRSHFNEPQALLNLTQALFGKCPQAWWIVVPGVDFQFSDRLSPVAQQGVAQALAQIKSLLSGNSALPKICTKSV